MTFLRTRGRLSDARLGSMTRRPGNYPRTTEYRERMGRAAKVVWLHRDMTADQVVDSIEIHCETLCSDCNARVLPTLNERGEIRCSSCRAGHITDITARRSRAR